MLLHLCAIHFLKCSLNYSIKIIRITVEMKINTSSCSSREDTTHVKPLCNYLYLKKTFYGLETGLVTEDVSSWFVRQQCGISSEYCIDNHLLVLIAT